MDVKQCRRCGKIFQFRGTYVCESCKDEVDRLFVSVRNFIYDNPKATMQEICEQTGASQPEIASWLREGRLLLGKESTPLLTCESCGAPIATGKFCSSCTDNIKNAFTDTASRMAADRDRLKAKTAPPAKSGMHVNINKK